MGSYEGRLTWSLPGFKMWIPNILRCDEQEGELAGVWNGEWRDSALGLRTVCQACKSHQPYRWNFKRVFLK